MNQIPCKCSMNWVKIELTILHILKVLVFAKILNHKVHVMSVCRVNPSSANSKWSSESRLKDELSEIGCCDRLGKAVSL